VSTSADEIKRTLAEAKETMKAVKEETNRLIEALREYTAKGGDSEREEEQEEEEEVEEKILRDPKRTYMAKRLLMKGVKVTAVAEFCGLSPAYVSSLKKRMFSISAEFPPGVVERVDEICKRRGITRSELLRMLVYRFLAEEDGGKAKGAEG
jgi:AraC-like DNA-binding protein